MDRVSGKMSFGHESRTQTLRRIQACKDEREEHSGKGSDKGKGSETRTNLEGSRNRSKAHMAGACGQRAAWKEKGPEKQEVASTNI